MFYASCYQKCQRFIGTDFHFLFDRVDPKLVQRVNESLDSGLEISFYPSLTVVGFDIPLYIRWLK